MALSNWLTRDEWNAVYFAAVDVARRGEGEFDNLGDRMRLGIGELVKHGYKFRGIDADERGNYTKRVQVCAGNETVLAELIGGYGGFDGLARAKEAIAFASREIPTLDFGWLSEGIATFEKEGGGDHAKAQG